MKSIIEMAREAGFEQNSLGMTYTSGQLPELLERFAALVRAAALEEAAEEAMHAVTNVSTHRDAEYVAAAIQQLKTGEQT